MPLLHMALASFGSPSPQFLLCMHVASVNKDVWTAYQVSWNPMDLLTSLAPC
jgi:hypothetical protein